MASWRSSFFFPAFEERLVPAGAIDVLEEAGFEVGTKLRTLELIDQEGHYCDSGEEVEVPNSISVKARLEAENLFAVECWKSKALIVCMFAALTKNPHLRLSWPQWREATRELESMDFRSMLLSVALGTNSAYVVNVVDAADDFEDRFIEIGQQRVIDTTVNHEYGHGIENIWYRGNVPEAMPSNVQLVPSGMVDKGFVELVLK